MRNIYSINLFLHADYFLNIRMKYHLLKLNIFSFLKSCFIYKSTKYKSHFIPVKMFVQGNVKRQKTKEAKTGEQNEFFAGITRTEYKPDSSVASDDLLRYRYYNASERLQGRTMEEWLRPTVCMTRGLSPNSTEVIKPWGESSQLFENYKRSIRAVFELCIKLGIKWWSATDRDITPEGESIDETEHYMDEIKEYLQELQQKTNIKPLWLSPDLSNNMRYINGATTNSDACIMSYAAYQAKKVLEMGNKLGAECFLFSGSNEGYQTSVNVDITKEIKHYASFLKLIVDYKERMGFRQQLLIDCSKNYENKMKTKYFQDPLAMLCFLKHYNLDRCYKLNVPTIKKSPLISVFGGLGSLDIKDYVDINMSDVILLMRTIVQQGGMSPGGLNICLPCFDGSYEAKDLAEAYVSCIDKFAKGLRIAVKLVNDSNLNRNIQSRYINYSSGFGSRFENSDLTLEDCEEQVKKNYESTIKQPPSIRYEHWSALLTQLSESNFNK